MYNLGIGPVMVQKAELRQAQRQFVGVLEVPDEWLEGLLDELVATNPALLRVRLGRGREVPTWAARSPDRDVTPREERVASASAGLREALWSQLRLERCTEGVRRAGFQLIGHLDSRGFLSDPVDEVARLGGVTLEEVRQAQALVMSRLEPAGCCASGPEHYLEFMVGLRWPEDPFFGTLIREHLPALRQGRFRAIGRAMDMDPEDVEEYRRMLVEHVEPWPARGGGDVEPDYVRPCMEVVRDEVSGALVVRSLESIAPRVSLDPAFLARARALRPGPERKEAARYLLEARAIVKGLEERRTLVQRVATAAVQQQTAFFEEGPAALDNLTLTQLAHELDRDPSTICRAVAGRYLRWGPETLALRSLFTSRGAQHLTPTPALRAAIRELIGHEDPGRPLSDQALADALKARGFSGVKRRTVAKHRGALGIPGSCERRRRS